jgi:hypothetical protein
MSAPKPRAFRPAADAPISEVIHPQTAALWGNVPQTFSMAGIINVATRFSKTWENVWCRVSS